jgi:hypothetical protein
MRKLSDERMTLTFVSVVFVIEQPQLAFSNCGPILSHAATVGLQQDIFSITGIDWQKPLLTNGRFNSMTGRIKKVAQILVACFMSSNRISIAFYNGCCKNNVPQNKVQVLFLLFCRDHASDPPQQIRLKSFAGNQLFSQL